MDKSTQRIEAKLDALLEKAGIKPDSVVKVPPAPKPVPLTAAGQQAIDNAPKPTPVVGPRPEGSRGVPRVDAATNAPSVAMSVPPDAARPHAGGGRDKGKDKGDGKDKDGEKVNWNS